MAIFSAKTLIIAGISTLAVGGIATGVGIGIVNSQKVNTTNELDKKEDEKEKENNTQNDGIIPDIKKEVNLQTYLDQIDLNKISFGNGVNKESTYAFNVDIKQIKLPEQEDLEKQDVKFKLEFDAKKNNASSLNDGKLAIKIFAYKQSEEEKVNKLLEEDESEEKSEVLDPLKIGTRSIELSFKAGDKELVDLLDNKSTLDLLKVKDSTGGSDVYKTLDELNETEAKSKTNKALTVLLKEQKNSKDPNGEKTKNVSVEGIVTLLNITKETQKEAANKSVFSLVSADETNLIKLVVKSEDGKYEKEALVGEIKSTNLLPTSVKLVPNGFNSIKTEANIKDIETNVKTNGYKVVKGDENTSSLVFIKNHDSSEEDKLTAKDLVVNSYVFDTQATELKELKFDVQVTYGNGTYQTVLNSNNDYDNKLLVANGFAVGIYAKKLTEADKFVEGTKLSEETKKLTSIFKEDGTYNNPVEKAKVMMVEGFSKKELAKLTDKNSIVLSLDSPDNKIEAKKIANLLVFPSYSFNGLEDKVLFTPYITAIFFEKEVVESNVQP